MTLAYFSRSSDIYINIHNTREASVHNLHVSCFSASVKHVASPTYTSGTHYDPVILTYFSRSTDFGIHLLLCAHDSCECVMIAAKTTLEHALEPVTLTYFSHFSDFDINLS